MRNLKYISGQVFLFIRKELGLTQTQLSLRMQVDQSMLSKIEKGRIPPSKRLIGKLEACAQRKFPEMLFAYRRAHTGL